MTIGTVGNIVDGEELEGLLVEYTGEHGGYSWMRSLEPERFNGDVPGESFTYSTKWVVWL